MEMTRAIVTRLCVHDDDYRFHNGRVERSAEVVSTDKVRILLELDLGSNLDGTLTEFRRTYDAISTENKGISSPPSVVLTLSSSVRIQFAPYLFPFLPFLPSLFVSSQSGIQLKLVWPVGG